MSREFPAASYDAWKTRSPDDEAERIFGPQPEEDEIPEGIVTTYNPPPIPLRCFDWMATRDDYEPPMPIGFGKTEREAVLDLLAIEADEEE